MKNITLAALIAIAITGCTNKEKPYQPPTPTNAEIKSKLDGAPKWVISQADESILTGVGSAAPTKAGFNFQRNEALALARDDLAKQLQVKVNNMTKHFVETTGVAKGETVDKVATQVSKQVTSQTITGSRQKDMWLAPDGELFVLVTIDASALSSSIKDAMASSFKNDNAMWQKFQAKQAQEELTKEVAALTESNTTKTEAKPAQ